MMKGVPCSTTPQLNWGDAHGCIHHFEGASHHGTHLFASGLLALDEAECPDASRAAKGRFASPAVIGSSVPLLTLDRSQHLFSIMAVAAAHHPP